MNMEIVIFVGKYLGAYKNTLYDDLQNISEMMGNNFPF